MPAVYKSDTFRTRNARQIPSAIQFLHEAPGNSTTGEYNMCVHLLYSCVTGFIKPVNKLRDLQFLFRINHSCYFASRSDFVETVNHRLSHYVID